MAVEQRRRDFEARFGHGNPYILPEFPLEAFNGHRVLAAVEYFGATPFVKYEGVVLALLSVIGTGELDRAIKLHEELKRKRPDWNFGIQIPITRDNPSAVRANNQPIDTFVEVRHYSKSGIFYTLGFGLYVNGARAMRNEDPQKLVIVHLA